MDHGDVQRRGSTSSLGEDESTSSEVDEALVATEMYDEDADQRDSEWAEGHHPGPTDAVLSCPACFTQICFVCQAHARFDGQFRALSVEHCDVTDQLFAFAKKKSGGLLEPVQDQQLQTDGDNRGRSVFRAVVCSACRTRVGVVDRDNVYHLFHVLASS